MLLSIYVGNKNHIGVIYSSYSNSLEVSCVIFMQSFRILYIWKENCGLGILGDTIVFVMPVREL